MCGGNFRILRSRFLQYAEMSSLLSSLDAKVSRVLLMTRNKFFDSSLGDSSGCFLLRLAGGLDSLEVLGHGSSLMGVGVYSGSEMLDSSMGAHGFISVSDVQSSYVGLLHWVSLPGLEGTSVLM